MATLITLSNLVVSDASGTRLVRRGEPIIGPGYIRCEPGFVFDEYDAEICWSGTMGKVHEVYSISRDTIWMILPLPELDGQVDLVIKIGGTEFKELLNISPGTNRQQSLARIISEVPELVRRRDYLTTLPLAEMFSETNILLNNSSAKIVYVTGSVGKTSTKEALDKLLRGNAEVICSTDSWNHAHETCSQIVSNISFAKVFILEQAASHLLPILGHHLPPDILLLTHLGEGHVSIAPDPLEVGKLKISLAERMIGGTIVWNGDSPALSKLVSASREHWVSRGNAVIEVRETDWPLFAARNGIDLNHRAQVESSGLALTNAMCCLLAAECLGQFVSKIPKDWPTKTPHRLEVQCVDGITLIKDAYNANPLSMRRFLEFVSKQSCSGRGLIILGEMLDLGAGSEASHQMLVELASPLASKLFLVGSIYEKLALDHYINIQRYSDSEELRNALFGNNDFLKQWKMIAVKGSSATGLRSVSDDLEREIRRIAGFTK
ncbi:cyanophycin synthetase [Methylobacterium sp. OT2]|uniref:glutamate ligase domain-containing protein n=1 Tax=Methylobacterium sp. OT2 TaxID=2813779 RepID=UPI00197BECBF|nr:cyanophycin synthetase [Methylobacterium sp. OT2]MBN4097043.1 hypothetical protein [Methylobacterium sp. OT2]